MCNCLKTFTSYVSFLKLLEDVSHNPDVGHLELT